MPRSNEESKEAMMHLKNAMAAILENIDNGFFSLDKNWQFVYINRKAANNVGYESNDLIGKNIWEMFPQIIGTDEEKNYRKVMMNHRSLQFQTCGVITNRWYEEKVYRTPEGIAIYWNDITETKKAEDALKESEEKFRNLAEESPNMIFINQGGRVVYANKKSKDILGYRRDEFYSPTFSFLALISPECVEAVKLAQLRHSKGEHVPSYEYVLITKEGKRIDAIIATKLIDYKGEKAVMGIVTDITERKKTEEALKRSEEKYRQMVNTAQEGILMIDAKGNITFANEVMSKWLGRKVEEIVNQHPFKFVRREDLAYARNSWMAKKAGEIHQFDFRFQRKDGGDVWVIVNATRLKNEQGKFTGILAMLSNITDRKSAEEKLEQNSKNLEKLVEERTEEIRRSEQNYRDLYESFDEAFIATDWELNVIHWNKAAERVTTVSAKEALGKKIYDVLPEMSSVDVTSFYKDLQEKKPVRFMMNSVSRQTGQNATFEISTYPSSLGIIVIVEDKTKEEETKRLSVIGQTASMVGHDIRNPLQAITSDLYLLREELKSIAPNESRQEMQESIESIDENIAYINKIVSDLQDYT